MIKTQCFENKTVVNVLGKIPQNVRGISTDSRTIGHDEAFIALKGDHFNGELFISEVLEKGASIIVVDQNYSLQEIGKKQSEFPKSVFIQVTDSLLFYQESAKIYLENWKKAKKERKVFGITGSNGKTTTKDMLVHFFHALFPNRILGTIKNFNNHIGVPKTIFNLSEEIDFLILEMGMNHAGELDRLLEIAPIDGSIITNIGTAHIEFLKSKENIFREKRKLYDYVSNSASASGPIIANYGDEYLSRLEKNEKTLFFGDHPDSDVSFQYQEHQVQLKFKDSSQAMVFKNEHLIGIHNYLNLTASLLFVLKLFPEKLSFLSQVASQFSPSINRSSWIEKNNKHYFLDAYNANPDSMRAAILGIYDYLKARSKTMEEALFILGDMNELGDSAPTEHKKIGELLSELKIKNVVFIGRYHSFYQSGFPNPLGCYEKREEFSDSDDWKSLQQKFSIFFIKASRSLALEKLVIGP